MDCGKADILALLFYAVTRMTPRGWCGFSINNGLIERSIDEQRKQRRTEADK